ncbi:hypothetical protein [Sphaerisporangium sp. NPDC051011]|uniref:FitA-like ribbon-helix-helix domain-containing protein n=1 Tax=Sphaerisporangium sp. NPDC051011 TaxID=3155792 RepID=UPI003400E8EA
MPVTVLVPDVPDEVVEILKSRASANGMSLNAYLREMLSQEAAIPERPTATET